MIQMRRLSGDIMGVHDAQNELMEIETQKAEMLKYFEEEIEQMVNKRYQRIAPEIKERSEHLLKIDAEIAQIKQQLQDVNKKRMKNHAKIEGLMKKEELLDVFAK